METEKTSGGIFQGASPQLTFIFGLIAGVAASAIFGLILFVTNGYNAAKSSAATTVTNTATAPAADTTGNGQSFTDVPALGDNDYVRGDKNAKLTLIEYSDYECPFCKSFHPTMKKILADYDGKVRWVYRNFPLSFHQNAQKEAEAALCVGKLGGADKFWNFSDKIFERTTSNGTGFALTDLPALAKEVGVSDSKFKDCLDGGEMASVVAAQESDGTKGGASGTPTTFVVGKNGKTISGIPGAYSYDQVKQIIDQALAS